MDRLAKYFEETIDDRRLTSSEKRALKEVLKEVPLGKRERDLLRSKVFEIALSKVEGKENRDILEWLYKAYRLLLPESEDLPEGKALFSPGDDCINEIIRLIKGAESSIDICVFTISDDRISREIVEAHRRGVKVKIITDDDKTGDRGSDIFALAKVGIEVMIDRTSNHMHHKFALFDGKVVLTGSYNWTRSAADYNYENIIVTDDKKMVASYTGCFTKLWKEMKRF